MNWEQKILQAWQDNAEPWNTAIQRKIIPSRERVSNQAIIDALSTFQPRKVLDIGCGEGWLCRALSELGVTAFGCDGVAELCAIAQKHNEGLPGIKPRYQVLEYRQLLEGYSPASFDICVFNFSLIGEASTEQAVRAATQLISSSGKIIIQTLDPISISAETDGEGWREGSWAGIEQLADQFNAPAPWYFRSLSVWQRLFSHCGLAIEEQRFIKDPDTQAAVSVIFCLSPL